MMNVRCRPRFAQKTRPRAGILRDTPVDDLERNGRVQDRIASAVSYGHCSGTELDRKTILTYFHFEVGVSQWSGRQPTARRWFFRLFTVREKAKANEATQALPLWTALSQRSSTCPACPRSFGLRFHTSVTMLFPSLLKSQLMPSLFDRVSVAHHQVCQTQEILVSHDHCCSRPNRLTRCGS